MEEVNRVQAQHAVGDTRELMRRDKEKSGATKDTGAIHRTKLERIHQLEASVCQDVLKEVCMELGTANIAEIMPAMRKITRTLSAVPKMEVTLTLTMNLTPSAVPKIEVLNPQHLLQKLRPSF